MAKLNSISLSDALAAHPALAEGIAIARVQGHPTFSDDQYQHTARIIAGRFPGLELETLHPVPRSATLAVFVWETDKLISRRIIGPADVPEPPKRTRWSWDIFGRFYGLRLTRVSRGRLRVRLDIPDCLHDDHPLAPLRPSVIVAKSATQVNAVLRMAADNSRVWGLRPTAARGQLRLIVGGTQEAQS